MTVRTAMEYNPLAPDFYTSDPFGIYRWMRDEAPVYYSEDHDFYALTRHEDVAPAFKDFETYSSRFGVDLSSVRSGVPTATGMKMIIFMDPPEHRNMRSLMNKVFTPRAIQAQKQMVTAKVEKYISRLDPDGFDARAWISQWLREPLPALGGVRPIDLIDTMEGQALVATALEQTQSGAYA